MLMRAAVVVTWLWTVTAFAQGGTPQQMSEFLSREEPSEQYQLAQYKDARFTYPLNWEVKTTNTGWLIMGPKFGLLKNGVVCGVTIGSFLNKESFEDASGHFITWMKRETPGGLTEREPQTSITIGGRQGKRWSFQATSLLQVTDQRERDDLILVPLSKGRIWWTVLTSLQQDQDFLQSVFSKFLQTIQFNDGSDDLGAAAQDVILTLSTSINTDTAHPGDSIQADVKHTGNPLRIVAGYLLEIRSSNEKSDLDVNIFLDNLRSSNSSAWITVDLIGVRNSKGQRGVDDNGTGIFIRNSELPIVTVSSPDTPFFTPSGSIVENTVKVSSQKITGGHLSVNSQRLLLNKGAELIIRISGWKAN